MRGLKTIRSLRTIAAAHAFAQNLRSGHYETTTDLPARDRVRGAFSGLGTAYSPRSPARPGCRRPPVKSTQQCPERHERDWRTDGTADEFRHRTGSGTPSVSYSKSVSYRRSSRGRAHQVYERRDNSASFADSVANSSDPCMSPALAAPTLSSSCADLRSDRIHRPARRFGQLSHVRGRGRRIAARACRLCRSRSR